ncbi:D-2-hydroxyacid dehydrogenase [Candidatus Bipolaricaulota bacterium]|nr:D-2-hydroxyacid dehydrogenase [Candidatus Bipolaricaulota bacterium]TFH07410.1 MAG: D-2-hydroxyacid dehydrogenase [Candidatus Atribacteria bacterium]
MSEVLSVLVYLRESNERYKRRLVDSDAIRYTFCESVDAVRQSIESADVVLGSISFPSHLLSTAKNLKWIQVTGAGIDAFLTQSSLPPGVMLTRADVGFGNQIAEYVMGHLLALTQQVHEVARLQQQRAWQPLTIEFLRGRTMGVAGTGSIGCAIASSARSMGMRTLGLATSPRPLPGFDTVYGSGDLASFLPQLDVLVLSVPLTAATRGMVGVDQLAWLKPSAIIVNIGRGAVVDEAALIDALQQHRIRAAILDVFEREPLPADSPLWSMDNVTVTSHHAGLNIPDEIIDFFLQNLSRFQSGNPLRGVVDLEKGY